MNLRISHQFPLTMPWQKQYNSEQRYKHHLESTSKDYYISGEGGVLVKQQHLPSPPAQAEHALLQTKSTHLGVAREGKATLWRFAMLVRIISNSVEVGHRIEFSGISTYNDIGRSSLVLLTSRIGVLLLSIPWHRRVFHI